MPGAKKSRRQFTRRAAVIGPIGGSAECGGQSFL